MVNQVERMKEILDKFDISVKPAQGESEIKCKLEFVANGPDGPFVSGKVACISINDKEVGHIEYEADPNEPEKKEIEIILNEYLDQPLNTIKLLVINSENCFGDPLSTRARFRMYKNRKKFVDERYDTVTLCRITEDSWII